MEDKTWWKEAVVYQIYPQSFQDSDGDGVGDIRGLIRRLDYIKELGAAAVWMCPIYTSPKADNGYDISDYYTLSPEYGTLDDFKELLSQMHRRGLRLLMDMVLNHTSEQNEWFLQSRSSRDNPYRDYYIWRDPLDGRAPNNWSSFFGGTVWDYDEGTGQYYLHLFAKQQPDLNWENPRVRQELYKMMNYWLDLGVDGFRLDAINLISKVYPLPSVGDPEQLTWGGQYFINGPRLQEFLKEMNKEVFAGRDVMTVGEMPGVTLEYARECTAAENHEFNMVFQFELMDIHGGKLDPIKYSLDTFKEIINRWQTGFEGVGWNSIYLNNHDQARQVSRFGDEGVYHDQSAKMLCTLNMTLKGTPYVYQGEELGMTNAGFTSIDQYRDIDTMNAYRQGIKEGRPPEKILAALGMTSRDNARTPMAWSSEPNLGFTEGTPWLGYGKNADKYNAQTEEADPQSVLHYYREMIRLRKEMPVLVYGKFTMLDGGELGMAYIRELDGEKVMVLLNFSGEEIALPAGIPPLGDKLIGNYDGLKNGILRPYEAAMCYVK